MYHFKKILFKWPFNRRLTGQEKMVFSLFLLFNIYHLHLMPLVALAALLCVLQHTKLVRQLYLLLLLTLFLNFIHLCDLKCFEIHLSNLPVLSNSSHIGCIFIPLAVFGLFFLWRYEKNAVIVPWLSTVFFLLVIPKVFGGFITFLMILFLYIRHFLHLSETHQEHPYFYLYNLYLFIVLGLVVGFKYGVFPDVLSPALTFYLTGIEPETKNCNSVFCWKSFSRPYYTGVFDAVCKSVLYSNKDKLPKGVFRELSNAPLNHMCMYDNETKNMVTLTKNPTDSTGNPVHISPSGKKSYIYKQSFSVTQEQLKNDFVTSTHPDSDDLRKALVGQENYNKESLIKERGKILKPKENIFDHSQSQKFEETATRVSNTKDKR